MKGISAARMAPILLGLIAVGIYVNALPNSFAQDDFEYVVHNGSVHGSPWRLFVLPYETGFHHYRPITSLTYWFNYATTGDQPLGFHLFNLFAHAIAVILLYRLLMAVQESRAIAFAAALIFAVHPIHSEAVAGVVGRAEVLCAAFIFAAWERHLRGHPFAAGALMFAAALSKETGVIFVALAVIGDFCLNRPRRMNAYATYAGVVAAAIGLRFYVLRGPGVNEPFELDNPLAALPALWRVPNALRVAMKYLALQVYPARLSADYSFDAITIYRQWLPLIPALVVTVILLALWAWSYRRNRLAFLAGAIYLVGFAITANVFYPIGTIMGERLAYLPSAGLCLLAALGWGWLCKHNVALSWILLFVTAVGLSGRTVVRNRDWKNDATLFASAIEVAPRSAKAHLILGSAYLQGRWFAEAFQEFTIAGKIYPEYPDLMMAEARMHFMRGDMARAEPLLRQVMLRCAGTFREDYTAVTYAAFLEETGRQDEALVLLDRVIARNPAYSRAYSNRAVIAFRRKQVKASLSDAETARQLDPNNEQAVHLLRVLEKGAAP